MPESPKKQDTIVQLKQKVIGKVFTESEAEYLAIAYTIKVAKKYSLLKEIMWSSLQAVKANPELSILDALETGLDEWIK